MKWMRSLVPPDADCQSPGKENPGVVFLVSLCGWIWKEPNVPFIISPLNYQKQVQCFDLLHLITYTMAYKRKHSFEILSLHKTNQITMHTYLILIRTMQCNTAIVSKMWVNFLFDIFHHEQKETTKLGAYC